jgi:phage gp45-like
MVRMKIKNMLARCIVNLVNNSGYSFTALNGENITSVEHLQEFGFASKMPVDEEGNGIAVFYGGDRGNASLLVFEVPKFKPDLANGESAIFNAFGAMVKLCEDGSIEASGNNVKLAGTDATAVELNGITNEGIVKINELTTKLNLLISEYDTHQHSYFNTAGLQITTIPSLDIAGTPDPATAFDKNDYENTKVVH